MDAIEIYQKIMEIAKEQDFQDVNTAINFARNKLESDYYASEKFKAAQGMNQAAYGNAIGCTQGLATNYPQPDITYAQKQHADAVQLVRSIVLEELGAQTDTPTAEAA